MKRLFGDSARAFAVLSLALLAAGCGSRSTDYWLKQLKDPAVVKRRQAIRELGERNSDAERVVPALVLSHGSKDHIPNNALVFDADATASNHMFGVNFLFGDGSVRPIRNTINGALYEALLTRAGNDSTAGDY